ncbi:hypothetical protein [Kitasatospora sp. NPDC088548]|uniref:hypothetical protein n=1 Tax=Kitasatospora sp. NPDC088548 TaxID=3364075 RepID=UPI0037F63E1D
MVELADLDAEDEGGPRGAGGRGLGIVDVLAEKWGVEPIGQYSKAIWAVAAVGVR